jgi:hypothetical protein
MERYWVWCINRWLQSPPVHHQCAEQEHSKPKETVWERPVPTRFTNFDLNKADGNVVEKVCEFTPDSMLHTLAIVGPQGTGKSRLMWRVVTLFFDLLHAATGAKQWPNYYLFVDLVTEPERWVYQEIKKARFVFVDDVGATDCYGRDRVALQDVIRYRVQKNLWTFLTIDDPKFDPNFTDLFRERALVAFVST